MFSPPLLFLTIHFPVHGKACAGGFLYSYIFLFSFGSYLELHFKHGITIRNRKNRYNYKLSCTKREVCDGLVRHQWLEIHRNGEITAAAGFYPNGGILYSQGEIRIGTEEGHINDATKVC